MELYKCYSWKMDGMAEDVQDGEGEARLPLLAATQLMSAQAYICQSQEYAFNTERSIIGMEFHCPLLLQSVIETVLFP